MNKGTSSTIPTTSISPEELDDELGTLETPKNTGASVLLDKEEDTIANRNRDHFRPFIEDLVKGLYENLDKAAEKGTVFTSEMPREATKQALAVILAIVQREYQSDMYEDRNLLETLAYRAGTVVGYPRGLVDRLLEVIPFSAHFRAGIKDGAHMSNIHVNCLVAKLGDIGDSVKDYSRTIIAKVEPDVPENKDALQPSA